MSVPETPSTHLYPQAIQVKLYQAFIFSIPILFCIILFLLFYLFYLKRRSSNALSSSSAPSILPMTMSQGSPHNFSTGLEGNVRYKFPTVVVDEELRENDSPCCVCLGDFEIKEKLLQVPSCKHVFHVDCIYNWLQTNSTCPLCRCSVIPITKHQEGMLHSRTEAV